jgi:hypothetical protein
MHGCAYLQKDGDRMTVISQSSGKGEGRDGEGAMLIVFGYLTMRGSLLALGVATGLYAIDGVLTVAGGSYQGLVIRASDS